MNGYYKHRVYFNSAEFTIRSTNLELETLFCDIGSIQASAVMGQISMFTIPFWSVRCLDRHIRCSTSGIIVLLVVGGSDLSDDKYNDYDDVNVADYEGDDDDGCGDDDYDDMDDIDPKLKSLRG